MLECPEICFNVLKYLQDWPVRENFALTCQSVHSLCLSETLFIPPIAINLCSPTSITFFQSSTVRTFILTDSETAELNNNLDVSIFQIIDLLETLVRLEELTVKVLFNKRAIRKLIASLTVNHRAIRLFVPAASYTYFLKRLSGPSTIAHKIKLAANIMLHEATSSSSEDEKGVLLKRKYDMYEVPVEVENTLVKMRNTLMKSFVDNGLAKLRKRRISNPLYLDQLMKQNIVNKDSLYVLSSGRGSLPWDQVCFASRPFQLEIINNLITVTATKFIKSVISFDDNWIFVTQLDAFIRNDRDTDPCAIDTDLMTYPETPIVKIVQKSYKRTTWHEMVILYGRLELLVTGGIYGDTKSSSLKSFLGAPLKIKRPTNSDSEPNIYLVQRELPEGHIIKEERLLQNYSRQSAHYKWGFRSTRFSVKGFTTLNPLYINTTSLEFAASLILKCLAYNSFTIEDQKEMVTAIHEAAAVYSLSIPRGESDLEYLRFLESNCNAKFDVVISAAIQLIDGLLLSLRPQTVVDGTLATSVYNNVIKYRCNLVNNSRISREVFLM
ncbi:hypothetical protein MFLAVUS_006341 [Mucor flavus]|uniref:F-box domain-containing protein n=1 Tax=Mucor flavus TaxID=439312 RepID=A0ABP9Z192_9FUNG